MGYARIVQYADITEVYEYDKEYINHRGKRFQTALQKKRAAERRKLGIPRSEYSRKRAKTLFFKTVADTLHRYGVPTLITLTQHTNVVRPDEAYKQLFNWKKNVKNKMGITLSYIAVPEWQPISGRVHLHLLVWGLCKKKAESEGDTRNLQRLYRKGFLDVLLAYDSSPKLASYLAKYFTKAYSDRRLGGQKAYTFSRDVKKPRQAGSNSLLEYADLIVPSDSCIIKVDEYDTKYFGKCRLKIYKNKHND